MISEKIDKYADIPDETLCDISRLIMHCAKLDHTISLILFQAVHLKENAGFVLMGQTSVSQKIKLLHHFIEEFYDDSTIIKFKEWAKDIITVNTCRNRLAHGVYRGKLIETNEFCFVLTSQYLLPDDQFTTFKIAAYSAGIIKNFSTVAESLHKLLTVTFRLEPWHEKEQGEILSEEPRRRTSVAKENPT